MAWDSFDDARDAAGSSSAAYGQAASAPPDGGAPSEDIRIDLRLLIGVLGASFCMAWHMVLLVHPGFLAPGWADADDLTLLSGFAIALFAAYFILSLLAGPFQRHRQLMGIVAMICSVAALFPLGGGYAFSELAVRVISAGVSVAAAMTLWVEFMCTRFGRVIRKSFSFAVALGMLWAFCLLMADAAYAQWVIMAYALASSIAYLALCRGLVKEGALPSYDVKETDERNLITWRPMLLTVMGSMAQGFSLTWLLPPEPVPSWMPLAAIGVALALSTLLLYDTAHRFAIKESLIRRLFLPVIATCILVLIFTPPQWRPLPALFAFAFSFLPYATALFATCEHIVRCRLSTARAFSSARSYAVAGLFCGLMFGRFATSGNAFGDATMQVWVVVVVLIFVMVFSLLSSKSFYPGDDEDLASAGLSERTQDADGSQAGFADLERALRARCHEVAKGYGLTGRQEEVLYLLARGRNTAYIQDELVISPHTVKAHTYAIYKKLDLHSQQELIDLVESGESQN